MNGRPSREQRRERHRHIRDIVSRHAVSSQQELARRLADRGFTATQATVSRDLAQLGLVKALRGGRPAYALPEDVGTQPAHGDDALRRVLRDLPVTVGRSGLILLLVASPGSAPAIAEAIDRSSLSEQEGTLAGDNTVLVLFRDEDRLERWLERLTEVYGAPLAARAPT
jgi:transcriptional regulator of arginine metabolism